MGAISAENPGHPAGPIAYLVHHEDFRGRFAIFTERARGLRWLAALQRGRPRRRADSSLATDHDPRRPGPSRRGQDPGAVVPCWHGDPLAPAGAGTGMEFVHLIKAGFGEILQHGYDHRQARPGLISFFTGLRQRTEWPVEHRDAASVGAGQEILRLSFGAAAAGFLPPPGRKGGRPWANCPASAFDISSNSTRSTLLAHVRSRS